MRLSTAACGARAHLLRPTRACPHRAAAAAAGPSRRAAAASSSGPTPGVPHHPLPPSPTGPRLQAGPPGPRGRRSRPPRCCPLSPAAAAWHPVPSPRRMPLGHWPQPVPELPPPTHTLTCAHPQRRLLRRYCCCLPRRCRVRLCPCRTAAAGEQSAPMRAGVAAARTWTRAAPAAAAAALLGGRQGHPGLRPATPAAGPG